MDPVLLADKIITPPSSAPLASIIETDGNIIELAVIRITPPFPLLVLAVTAP